MTSAAVAGPFGTLEALGLGGRSLYWGAIAGGSILLSFGAEYFARGMEGVRRLVAGVGFVVVVSSGTHAINALVFDDWGGIVDWAYLTAIVGIVSAAVHLLVMADGSDVPVSRSFRGAAQDAGLL